MGREGKRQTIGLSSFSATRLRKGKRAESPAQKKERGKRKVRKRFSPFIISVAGC